MTVSRFDSLNEIKETRKKQIRKSIIPYETNVSYSIENKKDFLHRSETVPRLF